MPPPTLLVLSPVVHGMEVHHVGAIFCTCSKKIKSMIANVQQLSASPAPLTHTVVCIHNDEIFYMLSPDC